VEDGAGEGLRVRGEDVGDDQVGDCEDDCVASVFVLLSIRFGPSTVRSTIYGWTWGKGEGGKGRKGKWRTIG
jgi:hypothetical protein